MLDLEGKFLVARPTMRDTRFREAVILVMEHSKTHSMGLVVNKPIAKPSCLELSKDFGIQQMRRQPQQFINYGGPVGVNKIIILHTPDWSTSESTYKFNPEVWATNSQEGIHACMEDGSKGPSKWLICIGQCQWMPGQLEAEILAKNGRLKTDAWLTTSLNANTIFSMKYPNRWKKTVRRVAQEQFTRVFNHAVQTQQ